MGEGNFVDLGARGLDTRLGRTTSPDLAFKEYPSISPYAYAVNNPINAIDPDGKRVYFVGGAGLDTKGWNYTERWGKAFDKAGIKGFTPIRGVSHDKPGSFPLNDILFTTEFRSRTTTTEPTDFDMRGNPRRSKIVKLTDKMIDKAVNTIIADLAAKPLTEGEQLNLTGYSYGSVLQAHVALTLSEKGYKVDNLILVGSPIPTNSELYQKLSKVTNIIREDIPNDKLSNPSSNTKYFKGAIQNSGDGPHFDLARPGAEADKKIENTVKDIKSKGVE